VNKSRCLVKQKKPRFDERTAWRLLISLAVQTCMTPLRHFCYLATVLFILLVSPTSSIGPNSGTVTLTGQYMAWGPTTSASTVTVAYNVQSMSGTFDVLVLTLSNYGAFTNGQPYTYDTDHSMIDQSGLAVLAQQSFYSSSALYLVIAPRPFSSSVSLKFGVGFFSGPCSISCQNGGFCLTQTSCQCTPGWSSVNCSAAVCQGPCANGGFCGGPNVCTCSNGWQGVNCTVPVCQSPCTNGGFCVSPGLCACINGFYGIDCTTPPSWHIDGSSLTIGLIIGIIVMFVIGFVVYRRRLQSKSSDLSYVNLSNQTTRSQV
jgi:hypothetical protein